MSNNIDQRVVEMRFDNKQFESNVSNTMSTLDKLKQKLNLTGASKGLENVNAAAKNVNMSGLGGAVETVTAKFSALQVMGVTALANITNSAVNAGKNIVKSLTIDPIMSGFSEYETKLGSIQTILANTEHQGTTMDQVTAALNELNLYADKTIYNFQEMTRNIGTFTAAGVDLDTSVRSIQGIANLAAVSGSTSQQASTAMYQLSQALATGTVKLMDWNSVVNAGMGGKVFQNALIQTAAMLDDAAENVEAWQAKNIDAYGSFRDSLTQGEWLTSEVLTRTLEQFTMAAQEGSKEWEAFKQSLMDQGYTGTQAEEILKMANTATDAATKVKTFTQLMDTLKESAQSGWAQTWETMIGDFEEAKEFFTGLSDMFGGIIGESADRRNTLLGDALNSNWGKLTSEINKAGVETEKFEQSIEKVVGKSKFDKLIKDFGSVEKAAKAGKITSDQLKEALKGLSEGSETISDFSKLAEKVKNNRFTFSMGGLDKTDEEVKQIQQSLNDLGYDISPDGKFGKATYQAVMAFQRAEGIKIDGIVGEETIAALEKATGKTGELTGDVVDLTESCGDLTDAVTKPSGRELLLESVMNIIKAIHRPLAAVGEALRNTFSVNGEQIYGALEKVNSITDKLVPKGLLDETTWDGLTAKLDKFGITEAELKNSLGMTLEKNGVDVDELTEKYGGLGDAFDAGAISADSIKEALLGINGMTESLINGGEVVDKVRRAFAGLFSVVKLVGMLFGGGFKVAFNVVTAICDAFGMSVLDVAANIGDALVGFEKFVTEGNLIAKMFNSLIAKLPVLVQQFKDWFAVFKETPAVQKLVEPIKAIRDAFDKLMSGEINVSEFANSLGTNLANALKALPEIAVQFGKDFLAGFTGGISAGVSDVVGKIVSFCTEFIAAFAKTLGIESPSKVTMEMGEYTLTGFTIGLQNGVSAVGTTIQSIGDKIKEWFRNTFTSIRDWLSKLDFGAIFAVGIGAGMMFVVKSIGDALDTLAAPLEGLGDMFEDVGVGAKRFLSGLGANLKAGAWEKRGKAMLYFAGAVAILAASLYVLAGIEDTGKLWSAVGAIVVLAAVIGGLMLALSKLQASAGEGGGIGGILKSLNFGAIALALIGMSVVILAMTSVVKKIGELDPDQATQGLIGLGICIGAIVAVFATFGKLVKGKSAQNLNKVGGMLIKLSVALLLLVTVAKLAGKLNADEMTAGGEFLVAFMAFAAGLAFINQFAGKGFNKIGGVMLKISLALMLMVGVVKLAGTLSPSEMEKGAVFAGAFLGFVAILAAIGMIPGTNIDKLGGTLAGIAGAMLILVFVAKMVSQMECRDMTKAAVGILGLTVIIALLVGIVDTAGKDAPKIAMTLLAMSVAIGILAGVAIMLSLMDLGGLAKGIVAVGLLSACMALMVSATRGANNVKGNLIVMTVAIGLMAAAVAALSLIDPAKLAGATLAMTTLMGMFALITYTSKFATGAKGTLIIITGVIIVLAGILYLLSALPVEKSIGTAAALSILLLSLAAALAVLSLVKTISASALGAMAIIALIVAGLGVVLGLLEKYDLAPSTETVDALSKMLLSMTVALGILALVGLAGPAAFVGLGALATLIVGLGGVLAGIGALVDTFPQLESFLEKGVPILETIGSALGSFFGNIVGGFAKGVTDGLPDIGTNMSTFMTNLQPFIDGMNGIDDSFGTKVESLVKAIGGLAGAELLGTITSWLPGSEDTLSNFGTKLGELGSSLSTFAKNTAGITPETIGPVMDAAGQLMSLKPSGDGLFDNDGIDDFGVDLYTFGTALQTFRTMTAGITTESIQPVVDAATALAGIKVPDDGFFGGDGIDNFGKDIAKFGTKMAEFATAIGAVTVDVTTVTALVDVANKLATIQIPDDGMFGGDGIDNFGNDIKKFGDKLVEYSTAVSAINMSAIDNAAQTVDKIVGTITSLVGLDTSGIASFKKAVGELASVDLSAIATSFAGAAESMKSAGANIIDSVAAGMNSRRLSLSTNMAGIVGDMKASIEGKSGEMQAAGVNLAESLRIGLLELESNITTAGKTLGDNTKSGAKEKYSAVKGAGQYLGEGFVAGVKSQYNAAYWVGYGLGEEGERGLEDALRIQSPSKEAIEDGNFFGEGLVIGIDQMGRSVYKAGYAMGNEGLTGISKSISRISDVINSDIDAQPTIRPVLDLSDVRSGADAIGSMLNNNTMGVTANVGAISAMMSQRSQNGAESEVVSAITKLRRDLANMPRESYNINGVTYDDGSNIKGFAQAIVHQARLERRV